MSPRRVNVPAGAQPKARPGRSGAARAGCGGVARFGKIYSCPTLTGDRQDVYRVTTTVDDDVLYGTVTQTSNNEESDSVAALVYDADGNYLCYFAYYPGTCGLGAAGTYEVRVSLSWGSGDMAYTLSVQSMRTPSSCRTLGGDFFSFAYPGRQATIPHGSAGECFAFDQPVGSVLHLFSPRSAGDDVRGQILDGNYQPLCPVRDDTECTLSTAGPYRLMMYELYGNAADYTLRMARISRSAGCPVLRPVAFGDPGDATGAGNLPYENAVACHKLRTSQAGGVAIRIDNDQSIWWNVYDDAGQRVCDKYDSAWSCLLPTAGSYTVLTSSQFWNPISYRIAAAALSRPAGCATTSLSWDQDAVLVHQTSALQTNCHQFDGTAGQRVVTYAAPTRYNEVYPVLVDATGRALCRDYTEETGCALPADGTYRVVTYLGSWDPESVDETYQVQARSLSAPVGCPVVETGAYNAPPAGALGPIRCRTVRISQPGVHRIRAFDVENNISWASVYDRTGHRICDNSGYCDVPAAGDYTMVLAGMSTNRVIGNEFAYVTSVLPRVPTVCPALTQDLYRGTFTDPGQYLCVQLRQSAGQRVIELVPTDARYPETYVLNSAGEYVCDSDYQLWQTNCELTGTGPHVAVLSQEEGLAPGAFAARFLRVDGPPSCPVLDASELTTGGDNFAVCRSIPADAHGARESFTWHRSSGTGGASLSVFDAAGTRYCGPTGTFPDRTATCSLPAGPLTVILNAASADATYQLSRQPA